MAYKLNPKFLNQIQYCEKEFIPLMVIIGDEERAQGGVKLRDVQTQEEVLLWIYTSCLIYEIIILGVGVEQIDKEKAKNFINKY